MSNWFTPKNSTILYFIIMIVCLFITSLRDFAVIITTSLVGMLFIVFIHECGHVLFGKMAKYQFVFLTIGPITIENTEKGITLTENNNWMLFGGAACMVPISIDTQQIRKQHALFAAGGPIISLSFAIVSYIIWRLVGGEFWDFFAIGNFVIFLVTAIPLNFGMKTDGLVFITMLRGGAQADHFLEEISIMNEMLSKKSPLEWNTTYLEKAKHKSATIEHTIHASYLFYATLLREGFEQASSSVAGFKTIPMTKESKYQLAFITHIRQLELFLTDYTNVDKIIDLQRHLSKMEPLSYYRGKAMICACQGKREKAIEYIQKMEQLIRKNEALYGMYEAEKELIKIVKLCIDKQKG